MAERKKIRRARKPMSPEQKEAAVARLAKAREERAKNTAFFVDLRLPLEPGNPTKSERRVFRV